MKQVLYQTNLWRWQHATSCVLARTMCVQHALAGVGILTRQDLCICGSVPW